MQKYNPEDYKQLKGILEVQSEAYKMAYGNSQKDFAENKMRDLYARLGNAILKEIKEFDKNAVISNEEYYGCTDEDIHERALKEEDGSKEYLEMSADLGNPYAQYQLAKLYLKSDNRDDIKKALLLLEKSASEGKSVMAQYALGKTYMNGDEQIRDIEKAREWLEEAFRNKNLYAAYALGKLYEREECGLCDKGKAVYYYEQAAKAENDYACYALGKLLFRESDKKCQEDGIKWLHKACEYNNSYAQYALGKIYIDQSSWLYDPDQGLDLLKKSADQNNEYAKLSLGIVYLKGEVVGKDMKMAQDYLQQSADQGNEYAKNILNNMDKQGNVGKQFKLRRGKRTGFEIERALRALKRSLNAEQEKYMNELEYQRLQRKSEKEL